MLEILSVEEFDDAAHRRTNNNFARNKAPVVAYMPKHGVIHFQKTIERLAEIDNTKWIKFFRMKLTDSNVVYAFAVVDQQVDNSYQVKLYPNNALRINAKVLGREILSDLGITYVNEVATIKFLATPCDDAGKEFKSVEINGVMHKLYFMFYAEYILGTNWDKEHVVKTVSKPTAIKTQSMINYYHNK